MTTTPGIDLLRKAVRYGMKRNTADDRLKRFVDRKDDLSFEELKQLSERLFGGMIDFDGDALRPVLTKMPEGMFPDPPRPNRFLPPKRNRLRLENPDNQIRDMKRQSQMSDDL